MALQKPKFKSRYENFINGKWTAPVGGQYFANSSPVDCADFCEVPRSDADDINLAVTAAEKAFPAWSQTAVAARSAVLLKIADRMEQNLELLATVETWDNGKSVRETLAADIPLAIDHFRYYAGVIRGEAGEVADLDSNTVSMEVHEPLGVVGQIIPWNFPILMATWKVAPALAAGKPLASSPRIAKVAFTGETTTGRLIMQYASENIIPVTLELGGKSPNIFFESVMAKDDAFLDKAIEGFVMFALNQGEVCTCPSRALIHESIYEKFMARALKRVAAIKMGDPLDPATMMGAQASSDQYEKILSYLKIGKEEGARVLIGGAPAKVEKYPKGFYIQPTVFKGHNRMRIFQEEIFGPVVSVTTFKDDDDAVAIANDTMYGLGSGIWTRDLHQSQTFIHGIQAGRVWVNCYHLYPAHASFGGYKKSGIGRETHKMMLDHYRHTKNVLMSFDKNPMGFF